MASTPSQALHLIGCLLATCSSLGSLFALAALAIGQSSGSSRVTGSVGAAAVCVLGLAVGLVIIVVSTPHGL